MEHLYHTESLCSPRGSEMTGLDLQGAHRLVKGVGQTEKGLKILQHDYSLM